MNRSDIIAKLKREILPLQGFKHTPQANNTIDLGPINHSFPNRHFPVAAVHEFISFNPEAHTATAGFVAAIMAHLMKKTGVAIWISTERSIFPPALLTFGVEPDRIIFVDLSTDRNCLWAMEEALRCESLAAVICE